MSKQTFTKSLVLADQLKSHFSNDEFTVVGIDGKDGVGKSTLAVTLASELALELIELDKFLIENQDGYVDYIKYSALDEALGKAKMQERSVIIEGVFLLEVLERLKIKPDILIYVKRVMSDGFWYDCHKCAPNDNPEELLNDLKESIKKAHQVFASPVEGFSNQDAKDNEECNSLEFRIVEYHQKYKPTELADYFFEQVWKK